MKYSEADFRSMENGKQAIQEELGKAKIYADLLNEKIRFLQDQKKFMENRAEASFRRLDGVRLLSAVLDPLTGEEVGFRLSASAENADFEVLLERSSGASQLNMHTGLRLDAFLAERIAEAIQEAFAERITGNPRGQLWITNATPALDANHLVATRVMGEELFWASEGNEAYEAVCGGIVARGVWKKKKGSFQWPTMGKTIPCVELVPDYAGDMAAAFKVAAKFDGTPFEREFNERLGNGQGVQFSVCGLTPRAICEAALLTAESMDSSMREMFLYCEEEN